MDERMLPPFLLISGPQDHYWHSVLEETLASLGHLQVVAEQAAIQSIIGQDYQAVIVDAGAVDHLAFLVSRIRAQRPDARVIVVTASPNWQLAREALQSGASDCIRKSPHRAELLSAFQAALSKPVLPWP